MNIYISDKEQISQRTVANNIPKKILNLTKKLDNIKLENKDIVILPDNEFNFFGQSISFYQKDKFTIKHFKDILTHIKNDLKWKIDLNINSNNYLIDNIYINQVRETDVFWWSGNISFDINILSPHTIYTAKTLPTNLWLIKYIHKTQNRKNFAILYINDKDTQLITTKNWFYDKIININLGINQIKKDMIEDNAIQAMYDNNLDNAVTQRILVEHYSYFNKLLLNRLKSNMPSNIDIYLSSKLSKSEIFMNIMKENLSKIWWWYIIPLWWIVPKWYENNIYIWSMILSGVI